MTTQLSRPDTEQEPTEQKRRIGGPISPRHLAIIAGGIAVIAAAGIAASSTGRPDLADVSSEPTTISASTSTATVSTSTSTSTASIESPVLVIEATGTQGHAEAGAARRKTGLPDGYWRHESPLPDCHGTDRC